MKRAAIIDIGTNTFHLLIADIGGDSPSVLYQETIAVKLGEGGISEGHINNEAFGRGISALIQFKASIDFYQPEYIKAVATSALRTASNGIEFIQKAGTVTGINIDIIDGDQEAEFIYRGVQAGADMDGGISLIIDIGGGSVEFILCNDKQIFWKRSYDIGAARLMDLFHHSDPITDKDIQALYDYLDTKLIDLNAQLSIYKPRLLIGSAGAFETFAELSDPEFKILFEKPEFEIELDKFKSIAEIILKSSHEERSQMPAIIPLRVDMIVMATLLTKYVLDLTGFKVLKLSTYSLKEGILFGMLSDP